MLADGVPRGNGPGARCPRGVQADTGGNGHVQAFDGARQRNADQPIAGLARQAPQPLPFGAEHPGNGAGDVRLEQALAALVVYAVALATTFLPALRASRVYPAEALRYQ